MKYRVNFSGFAYVEADDEEQAKEFYFDDEAAYKNEQIDCVREVDEFLIEI